MHLPNRRDQGYANSAIILIFVAIDFVAIFLTGIPLIADILRNLPNGLVGR